MVGDSMKYFVLQSPYQDFIYRGLEFEQRYYECLYHMRYYYEFVTKLAVL